MIVSVSKSAVVDFTIFDTRDKNSIVAAGALAYLQRRIGEDSAYSIDDLRKELVSEFGFKESTINSAISSLVGNGIVKLCEDTVENYLTNGEDTSRIKSEPAQVTQSQAVQPKGYLKPKPNNNYILSDFSFHPESPLVEVKDIIIHWWNNYKSGARTERAWLLQRNEFKKIYEDVSVKHDIEAISMSVENAIRASENSKTNKSWMAITYEMWVTYSKEKWIQYKKAKDKMCKSGSGNILVADNGAWLGQLKIPTSQI